MTELAARPVTPPRLTLPGAGRLYRLRRLGDLPAALQRRRIEPVRQAFYDSLWADAAAALGAVALPGPAGLTRIARGDRATFVRQSDLALDSQITLDLVGDKAFCYRVFAARGLPVPRHLAFVRDDLTAAEAFLRGAAGPVVVKPRAGTGGGRGVTTGITSARQLRRAAGYAAGYGPGLLLEDQLPGASFRLLFVDGRFVDAVRREAPRLAGDGQHTLRQLVAAENRRRRTGPVTALSPLRVDGDMKNRLAQLGLAPGSRLARGESIAVKGAVNENGHLQNHPAGDAVHPDILAALSRLVTDMGVRCAGVDILGDDLTRPMAETGAVLHEVNANPGLHHHVLTARPDRRVPVAQLLLAHMFDTGAGMVRP